MTRVLAHAHAHEQVYAAIGIHPSTLCRGCRSSDAETLLALAAAAASVVAIGETGLDYYHGAELRRACQQQSVSSRSLQCRRARAGLPVIVHTRDARETTPCELLERTCRSRLHAGVMHCFTESLEMARAATRARTS
jgi:TatD DNase family protein